ncbi:TetR family transcriptional regulator [Pseudoalteromonas sp. NBT06-2]|uniref:TetR/AcrR family transcriptional regulator n=1 Tax=Pseudoalteromonas sp. NBT06-2 TaxID=2025950 RepID=UPI000BA58611|nr:TetR/AcrR family transcriptional regulator [Pseudoalteromonas sp. NBT06-2]PAJ75417.1 TetR family transcriptional regulator [Pseudoalteromonas sp. NBT06-2]
MPKIVDREAYRQELANKAVKVFAEHGYNGLGMRGIAEEIGVSKSALYHYFPSKKDLFSACTELITQPHSLYGKDKDDIIPTSKVEVTKALLTTLDNRFQGEMVLLLDYIKNREIEDIAKDPLLRRSDSSFLNEFASIVGQKQSDQAYALMMGGLLVRLMNGNQTSIEKISSWINNLSDND